MTARDKENKLYPALPLVARVGSFANLLRVLKRILGFFGEGCP